MRSSGAYSAIFTLTPMPNAIFLAILALITFGLIIYSVLKINYYGGLKHNTTKALICLCVGIVFIILGYAISLDARKYTHGSEETTGQVIDIDKDTDRHTSYRRGRRRSYTTTNYTYLVRFQHEGNDYDVKMKGHGSNKMDLEKGDYIEIYYFPESLTDNRAPIVAAVELETEAANGYIVWGVIFSIFSILIILYNKAKEKLLKTGFHLTAKVTQVSSSGRNPSAKGVFKNQDYILLCQGKDPTTGVFETYKTYGSYNHLGNYSEGDAVHVFVNGNNSKFYIINI